MNPVLCLRIAAISGLLSVALGAFGAHMLKETVSEAQLVTFETGVRYQMYHALGLMVVGVLLLRDPDRRSLAVAAWAWIIGTLLFSGSLYALSLSGIRALGAITPIGGVGFLVGWASLAIGVRQHVATTTSAGLDAFKP